MKSSLFENFSSEEEDFLPFQNFSKDDQNFVDLEQSFEIENAIDSAASEEQEFSDQSDQVQGSKISLKDLSSVAQQRLLEFAVQKFNHRSEETTS
jgi:hypothetical protein